jgi:hypothetical protein
MKNPLLDLQVWWSLNSYCPWKFTTSTLNFTTCKLLVVEKSNHLVCDPQPLALKMMSRSTYFKGENKHSYDIVLVFWSCFTKKWKTLFGIVRKHLALQVAFELLRNVTRFIFCIIYHIYTVPTLALFLQLSNFMHRTHT